MSNDSKIKWSIIGLILIIDGSWIFLHGYRLALPWRFAAFTFIFPVEAVIFYNCWWVKNSKWLYFRIGHCFHVVTQLTVFLCAVVILGDLVATANFPFVDHTLSTIDRTLGFDWLRWRAFTEAHPTLNGLMDVAYRQLAPQTLASLVFLAATDRDGRSGASEFIWAQMIAFAVIIPLSGVWPAAGADYYYNIGTASYLPDLLGLRDGSLTVLSVTDNKGIVQFPSYHTTAAILSAYAFRYNRYLFSPNLALSLLIILAVPTFGNHYLCDLLGGVAVAAAAIWAARMVLRQLTGHPKDLVDLSRLIDSKSNLMLGITVGDQTSVAISRIESDKF